MAKYRILYDTNILVHREDHHVLSVEFIRLTALINELHCSILIHPLSIEDIKNDKDLARRKISESKLSTYIQLEDYPRPERDVEFITVVGPPKKSNDVIDDHLLYAVYRNAVDFLITEDKGILAKANRAELDDKVFSIEEAISIFEKLLPKVTAIPLLACFRKLKGWNVNLEDEIFDTLKAEYNEFVDWWKTKVSQRDIFIYSDSADETNFKIKAVLVLKEEPDEPIDCTPSFNIGRRLKICLFKVSELASGLKLGERLLKMALEQAITLGLEQVYLTHFVSENDKLVTLIENFGFQFMGKNTRGEGIYLKHVMNSDRILITEQSDISKINKIYFPSFYSGREVKKHLVPIQPYFHEKLFPDYGDKEIEQLKLFPQLRVSSSEGYSIKKAYICNSNSKQVSKGDILLFYRTEDIKAITSLGTVEEVYYDLPDVEEVYKRIAKRTVYTLDEIKSRMKKNIMVILFRHNLNFLNDVPFAKLIENKIVNGTIQSVTTLDNEAKYKAIIEGNIDERLIIHKTEVCR